MHQAAPREAPQAAPQGTLKLTDPARDAPAQVPLKPRARAHLTSWNRMAQVTLESDRLARARIITARREEPAHAAFDVLRTRLLQTLSEKGWTRVAITSPTAHCGKTFTAANLAISLSRQDNCRAIVLDCDLRSPSLAKTLGAPASGSIADMLRGTRHPDDHLVRLGPNDFDGGPGLAFALSDSIERYPAELLQDPRTRSTLDLIEARYEPDVMLFDLPPALVSDDVMAFRSCFDAVLLVIGGGLTTARDVKDTERRLGTDVPLLGTILNQAENVSQHRYTY